jgi:hypothetical protein
MANHMHNFLIENSKIELDEPPAGLISLRALENWEYNTIKTLSVCIVA